MRLPSHVLAALVGLAACEKQEAPHCKSEPVVEKAPQPMAAPKPQPPQPVVKKPQKRMVQATVCGHTQLVEENLVLARCGQG